MSKTDNSEGIIIMLAGQPTKLVIDIPAMGDIEQTLELMKGGLVKKTFFQLLDLPYDIREEIVILMHGLNGAARADDIDKRYSFAEVQKVLGDHFKHIARNINNDKTIKPAEKGQKFSDAQNEFMLSLNKLMRKGLGYEDEVIEENNEGNPQTATPE